MYVYVFIFVLYLFLTMIINRMLAIEWEDFICNDLLLEKSNTRACFNIQ